MYFHYFVNSSPWKWAGLSFEQKWIPFTQGCIVPGLVEIDLVVLEKKMECEKFTTMPMTTPLPTTTDNGQILIRKAHLSLLLRWAKNVTAGDTESIKVYGLIFHVFNLYSMSLSDHIRGYTFHLHVLSHTWPKTFIFQKMFSYLLRWWPGWGWYGEGEG